MQKQKPHPVRHVAHWFFGNICIRRCRKREKLLVECFDKLEKFADCAEKAGCPITFHKEFFRMMENGIINICKHRREAMPTVKEFYSR